MEFGSETGIEYLFQIKKLKIKINSIVLIGHEYSNKRGELLKKRTGGLFKRKDFTKLIEDLYIPVYFTSDINSKNCFDLIKKLKPDLIVFEGSKIIRNNIYSIPKFGMLNVHLAILPYLRGCSCMEWSIVNNYPLGVTCHYLTKSVDAGAIINRFSLYYNGLDTYSELRVKLLHLASYSMAYAINSILNGFRIKDAHENLKGKWFSPMNSENKIKEMKLKITNNEFKPISIDDSIPLEIFKVSLKGEIFKL